MLDHRPLLPAAAAVLALAFAGLPCLPKAHAGSLKVRMYDAARYKEEGELKFVVDASSDGAPIESLARGKWSLDASGKPVDMTVTASAFRAAGMPTSVLVILPATPNFVGSEDMEDEEGRQRPIRFVLEAVSSLKTSLGQSDLVSIHCYDELRPEPVALTTNRKVSRLRVPTEEEIDTKCRSDSSDTSGGQPRLQTLLLGSIQKWLAKRPSSGREVNRFVVVAFTDGVSKEAIQEKWFKPIIRGFSDPTGGWIELYVLGLEDGGDPANLQALARSGVLASAPVRQDIPNELNRITPLVSGAGLYSVEYRIEDSIGGPSTTFTIGVDGGGQQVSGNYTIAGLEARTRWLAIVLYVVCAIVGLVLLVLVIRMIASAVAARRRRREEEAEAMASQQYEGPSRGRLIVRDGPATGETFHLVDDLTYIGRSAENGISLPDPSVGKRHASIRIKDRSYTLEDLQSVNGVYVNGQRVLKANLKNGDSIRMGGTEMQFSL